MGFKSFKRKFKKYTGISAERALAATVTFGGSEVARVFYKGSSVEDFVKDPTGAKAASKSQAASLRAAGKIEEAHRVEAAAARNEILAETASFREQGQLELERFRSQKPGETEFFKQSLERGTEAITQQRDRFGLVESGRTGEQFNELGSNLLLQEELNRQQGIGRAAQLSQTGYGLGLEALRQEGGAAYRQAQTAANVGAVNAQAKQANRQFYTNLAVQAGGVAAGSFFGPAGAVAGGVAAGTANSVASQRGSNVNLQYPQYNQFAPQY